MKIKNSHILMISLISVFLLLSLASVSASDDIAIDDASADMDDINDMAIKDSHKLAADEASGSEQASNGNSSDASNAGSDSAASNAGNATATGNSTNDDKYTGPVTNVSIVPVTTVLDYQTGEFTFKVVDKNTGNPLANETITVNGPYFYTYGNGTSITSSKAFTTNSEGLLVIPNYNMNKNLDTSAMVYNFTALDAGVYNLTFRGNESIKVVSNNTIPITVNVVNAQIQASNLKTQVGSGKRYEFKVVNSVTGEALKYVKLQFKIKLNSSGYTTFNATTNMSGEAGFNLNLVGGSYPLTIVDNDTNIKASSVSRNITITKKTGVITASDRVIYYNSAATAIIKFTDKKTGKAVPGVILKVRLWSTSKKYTDLAFTTNSKGQVSFKAALSLGKHKMIISTADGNYTATRVITYTTLKATTAKFTAYNINTYYNSGKNYVVTLKNAKNGNAIYGASLKIRVYIASNKYYQYDAVTNGNGQVALSTNSLAPGSYKITIIDSDAGYTASTISKTLKITKVPTKLSANATTVKYNSGKYLQVKASHSSNDKALSGVKLTVKVYTSASKYTTYTIKTKDNGIATYKIVQNPGTYKVVISSANSYYTASAITTKITVKE